MSCREQLSSQVEQLKTRLAESHQSLQSSTVELQQLQVEHDTLLERHNKILQETISKEAELRERCACFTLAGMEILNRDVDHRFFRLHSVHISQSLNSLTSPYYYFLTLFEHPGCCRFSQRT